MVVAHGIGPRNFRFALIAVAFLYYVLLLHPPNNPGPFRPVIFFMQATALFPRADVYALEFRIAGWSCKENAWKPMDPTPYFPIQADDKESRLQRVAYFYKSEKVVMHALDEFVYDAHTADPGHDGIDGPIGGIKLVQVDKELPTVGSDVERYHWEPFAPIDDSAPDCKDLLPHAHAPVCNLFYASQNLRKKRCGTTTTP
jgi:hypothetical protein